MRLKESIYFGGASYKEILAKDVIMGIKDLVIN